MTTVTIDEMQHDLRRYLERVRGGETLLVVESDDPVAEIKPASRIAGRERPFGLCRGQFTVPDDFDAPLPDEVLV